MSTFCLSLLSPCLPPSPTMQSLSIENICDKLRNLYLVRNLSMENSVIISCTPSSSANNEIHVSIVSSITPAIRCKVNFSVVQNSVWEANGKGIPVGAKPRFKCCEPF